MKILFTLFVSLMLPFVTAQNAQGQSKKVSFIDSFHQLLLDTELSLTNPSTKSLTGSTDQISTKTLHSIHHKHRLKKHRRNQHFLANTSLKKFVSAVDMKSHARVYKINTNKPSEWKAKYDTERASEFWIDFERGINSLFKSDVSLNPRRLK